MAGRYILKVPASADASDSGTLPARARRVVALDASAPPNILSVNRLFQSGDFDYLQVDFQLGANDPAGRSRETRNTVEALRAAGFVTYYDYIVRTVCFANDTYDCSFGAWGNTDYLDTWGLSRSHAPDVWSETMGDGQTVAVLDTGIDYNHPDLAGQVDLTHSKNFVNGSATPMDDFGHGTHVSGIIAALVNNGIGIAGVAPHAKLQALKVCDNTGSCFLSAVAAALRYAADNGATVANMSFGGVITPDQWPSYLTDAVAYAAKKVVMVAAAGNFSQDVYSFTPANSPHVMAVSAFDPHDAAAFFTNFGTRIAVGAPGGGGGDPAGAFEPFRNILSLLASQATPDMTGNGQLIVGGQYLRQAGTSMASPFVAGVAALVRAAHPSYDVLQVRQAIEQGADAPSGHTLKAGYGLVDAAGALAVSNPIGLELENVVQAAGASTIPIFGVVEIATPWTLAVGCGSLPTSWTTVASGTQAVTADQPMAVVPLSDFCDGTNTLRLQAGSSEYRIDAPIANTGPTPTPTPTLTASPTTPTPTATPTTGTPTPTATPTTPVPTATPTTPVPTATPTTGTPTPTPTATIPTPTATPTLPGPTPSATPTPTPPTTFACNSTVIGLPGNWDTSDLQATVLSNGLVQLTMPTTFFTRDPSHPVAYVNIDVYQNGTLIAQYPEVQPSMFPLVTPRLSPGVYQIAVVPSAGNWQSANNCQGVITTLTVTGPTPTPTPTFAACNSTVNGLPGNWDTSDLQATVLSNGLVQLTMPTTFFTRDPSHPVTYVNIDVYQNGTLIAQYPEVQPSMFPLVTPRLSPGVYQIAVVPSAGNWQSANNCQGVITTLTVTGPTPTPTPTFAACNSTVNGLPGNWDTSDLQATVLSNGLVQLTMPTTFFTRDPSHPVAYVNIDVYQNGTLIAQYPEVQPSMFPLDTPRLSPGVYQIAVVPSAGNWQSANNCQGVITTLTAPAP